MAALKFFVTGHKGFETLLFHELRELLSTMPATLKKQYGGVAIDGDLDCVYRVCLHSRLANRVFTELSNARVANETQLYEAVYAIDWSQHLDARGSLAVSATLSRSKLNHTRFVAQRCKDAIVDQFRERCGSRPVVDTERPDLRIHVHIHHNQASISLDLAGESLHRRGYRLEHAGAPLKEHLAAALLMQAGVADAESAPSRLLDPMCGSGTFAIEAAMMAARMPPALDREYFGFLGWRGHRPELWQQHLAEAREAMRDEAGLAIQASDYDQKAIDIARANARRAGVEQWIEFRHCRVDEIEVDALEGETLVICNPPYGQRLQAESGLAELYADLGALVVRVAPARLAIISANPDLLHRLKLTRITRKLVRNGPLECLFAEFATGQTGAAAEPAAEAAIAKVDDEIGVPLRNRLLKNARHLARWARRSGVSCYRVYDADLPEFAFALDRYQSEISADVEWFHLQEYQAPASIDAATAEYRLGVAQAVIKSVFALPDDRLYCKTRSRQRGRQQYHRQGDQGEFFQVRESAASLLINLSDYLDSGLFLDHRLVRDRVFRQARGKRVLNLFCYTATVGVLAALGGATSVVNVDLSNRYLEWARENHRLNGLDDEQHYRFLRADILELLANPSAQALQADFDLVFLDPPSFSNSSKMQQTLDIQRDHERLVRQAMDLLKPDGLLLFSTNRRGFKLAEALDESFDVHDITRETLPEDFRRNPKIHRCWQIRRQVKR